MPEQDNNQYQCPNVDCDNCQLYNEDQLPTDKKCPECSTVLVTFDYDESGIDDADEEENEDDDYLHRDYDPNDPVID